VKTYRATPTDKNGRPIGPSRPVEVNHADRIDAVAMAVPDDSIPTVLDWVGYDPERAKAAITAELARDRDSQRTSLIEKLQGLLATPES
jgi:hypothetical protein